jgi:hypothetical protein
MGAAALGLAIACGNDASGGGDDGDGGSSGSAPTGGSAGRGGASSGAAGAAGSSGGSGDTGEAGASGAGGGDSGGTGGTGKSVPLPDGSRERAGVVNLVDAEGAAALAAFLNLEAGDGIADGLRKIVNLFLETYVEQYDFVFLVTESDLDTTASGRFISVTQTAVRGTGVDYDVESAGYKTTGRLRGIVGVNYNDYFGPFGHEMLHARANFLDPALGFGVGLDQNFGVHWGYTGFRGILGGFDASTLRCETPANAVPPNCTAETSGRYRYRVASFGKSGNSGPNDLFSPLELYLLGLIPSSEVPSPITVLEEAADVSGSFDPVTGTVGIEAAGVRSVEMSAIIARHGEVPESTEDERALAAVFVVVSATPASDAALDHVGAWAAIFGNRLDGDDHSFETLTGGRATLDTTLGPRRSVDDPSPAIRVPERCDIRLQDCDADKACFFFESGNACGFAGDGVRDEPCTVTTQCAPGFECSPSLDATRFACEPYCSLDAEAPDACVNTCNAWLLVDEAGVQVGGVCRAP